MLPKCIASCSFAAEVILVLFSNLNGVDWFWRLFSRSVRSNLDLCFLFSPIYQKRCRLWSMFVWITYTKSYNYDISFYLVTFDLGLPLEVESRSLAFKKVVSHKWCIIWPKCVWNTYSVLLDSLAVRRRGLLFILIRSIKALPKCIASYSASQDWSWCCSQILILLNYFIIINYFQGQKGSILTCAIYLGQYIRNGACYDQCLYVAHIQSHIWSFSLP